jgi:hypothetical protein
VWEQQDADATTGLVRNAIHFRYSSRGTTRTILNAFTYHWRLWSIPELTDAMTDAGFGSVECHDRLGDAIDSDGRLYIPPHDPDHRLEADWVVYVVGRT